MNRNLIIRTISGIIYVGIIVVACMLGNPGVIALSMVMAILAMCEYKAMYKDRVGVTAIPLVIDVIAAASMASPLWGWAVALLCLLCRMAVMVYDKRRQAVSAFMVDASGYLYIGMPMAAMSVVGLINPMYLLCIFITIWLNDTGAYCVGSLFGKHKFFRLPSRLLRMDARRLLRSGSQRGFLDSVIYFDSPCRYNRRPIRERSKAPSRTEGLWQDDTRTWRHTRPHR